MSRCHGLTQKAQLSRERKKERNGAPALARRPWALGAQLSRGRHSGLVFFHGVRCSCHGVTLWRRHWWQTAEGWLACVTAVTVLHVCSQSWHSHSYSFWHFWLCCWCHGVTLWRRSRPSNPKTLLACVAPVTVLHVSSQSCKFDFRLSTFFLNLGSLHA
jgi:hypothetical protein